NSCCRILVDRTQADVEQRLTLFRAEVRKGRNLNIKRTCFVIMPYDKKTIDVGGETTEVDFDKVYEAIIEPAIASLSNPKLFCLRADRDQKTGIVSAKVMSHIQESAVC